MTTMQVRCDIKREDFDSFVNNLKGDLKSAYERADISYIGDCVNIRFLDIEPEFADAIEVLIKLIFSATIHLNYTEWELDKPNISVRREDEFWCGDCKHWLIPLENKVYVPNFKKPEDPKVYDYVCPQCGRLYSIN